MVGVSWVSWLLAAGAVLALGSTYPYVATAIAYRHRDNGLAYLLLLMAVGLWNGMLAVQLVSPDPTVDRYFLNLAIVGALLAGLGWLLFATTASSTPVVPRSGLLYGVAATLVGVDIALALTTPLHDLFWAVPEGGPAATTFAVIEPTIGYWLHTQLLVLLFGGGTVLFAAAWESGTSVPYTRAYTLVGTLTVSAVIGCNVLAPGGTTVAPVVAAGLTTTAWVQAQPEPGFGRLRSNPVASWLSR